jgi:hypothetical protein
MIRNKRTTFAACINSVETLVTRSSVPRLAAPVINDTTRFHFPPESPEYPRSREMRPEGNPSRTVRR